MPSLLCIGPDPTRNLGYGRVLAALLPRWGEWFDRVDHADIAADQLGFDPKEYTHIWIMGSLGTLAAIAKAGMTSRNFPNTLIYAYALISTPFVDVTAASICGDFDFFVTLSDMASAANRNALTVSAETPLAKSAFISAKNSGVIPPGLDTTIFTAPNIHAGDFFKSEIREVLFENSVRADTFLVVGTGSYAPQRGYPEWLSTIAELKRHSDRNVVGYLNIGLNNDLVKLCLGNDLDPNRDILFRDSLRVKRPLLTDHELALLYQSADLYLNTSYADAWPFGLVEAMACGTLCAAPADHVWYDIVADNRGVPLPANRFGPAYWAPDIYVRSIDPGLSAQAILEATSDTTIQDTALTWAHLSTETSWDRIAKGWLGLFGLA